MNYDPWYKHRRLQRRIERKLRLLFYAALTVIGLALLAIKYGAAQQTDTYTTNMWILGLTPSTSPLCLLSSGLVPGQVTNVGCGGGPGTGTVNSGNAYQLGAYPALGTTIGPAYNLYALQPAMTVTQINNLFAGLTPGKDCVLIPPAMGQIGWTNTQGICTIDLRIQAAPIPLGGIGVACDETEYYGTITSGTNQINTGSNVTTPGQTITMSSQTGYGINGTQQTWAATVDHYTYPYTYTTANAPFSFTGWFQVGTDNTSAINAALLLAGYSHPLQIGSGCRMLTQTLTWGNGQSILGQQSGQGGFVGFPGQDILQQPDTSGQSVSLGGLRMENVGFQLDAGIDATKPYTSYSAAGTPTTINAFYRPLDTITQDSNNPCGPGWMQNCSNGVASITQFSNVICYYTGSGTAPIPGETIVFPYTTAVFTTTISSLTGSGCGGATSPATLAAAFPNTSGYTVSQAEYFQGTAVQSTNTTISASPSYPFTITMNLPIQPVPGFEANVATHGTIKFGSTTCQYLGNNGYATNVLVVRQCQNPANYSGTTTVVPLNYCSPGLPWPVGPTINSGDSTPHGAVYYPGLCGGNAAISFPQANGNTYAGSGLTNAFVKELNVDLVGGQQGSSLAYANNTMAMYEAGATTPYDTTIDGCTLQHTTFGIAQGPASEGQHGVHLTLPTSAGNRITNCTIRAAHPLIFVSMQQSKVDRNDTYSTAINPYDGTTLGGSTWFVSSYTLDEQTGAIATSTSQDTFEETNDENENGTYAEIPVSLESDCNDCTFENFTAEPGFNIFGGGPQKFIGGFLSNPVVIYGQGITLDNITGLNIGYISNAWPSNFLNWGPGNSCSAQAGGGSQNGAYTHCGAGLNQTYNGQSADFMLLGNFATPFENALSGKIKPGEWNCNGSLDNFPMSTCFTVDNTEPQWGSYATCNISTSGLCQPNHYNSSSTGYIYVGPKNRLSPGSYILQTYLRTVNSSNTVSASVSVFDDGSGRCTNPANNIATASWSVTTTWNTFYMPVNFATRTGCYLALQFGPGSATDTLRVGGTQFIPMPGWVVGPGGPSGSAPTEGGSCPVTNTWLGVFSGYSYFCDGGVVRRAAVT